jgi:hypothetical protein
MKTMAIPRSIVRKAITACPSLGMLLGKSSLNRRPHSRERGIPLTYAPPR